jgi:hypothetical protein
MSLAEALRAMAVTAIVVALGAALVSSFSTGVATLPRVATREASDARVQAMIAELRDAVGVTFMSPGEIVAAINTRSSPQGAASVNGASTGAYRVAYYF